MGTERLKLRRRTGIQANNESLAEAYFSPKRLSPNFRPSDITRPRVNGHLGLVEDVRADAWRLQVAGAATPVSLTLDDVRSLPAHEMITNCDASKAGRRS